MAYREQGAGQPLLLVHGWAAHGGFFQPQIDALSSRFRVIAPDLRGHGRSPARAEDRLSVETLADDLYEFILRLDLKDAVAVGWSMGAMVLWRACLGGAAERLAGLVVEDMSPRIVNDADWALGMKGGYDAAAVANAQAAMRADWPAYARAVARNMVADAAQHGSLVDWQGAEIAAQAPEPLIALWGSLGEQDFRASLAEVQVPTLVLHGRFGPYQTETSRFLEQQLPDATRVCFEDAGHAPHLEAPERFNRAIIEFAATLAPHPAPRAEATV